MCQCLVVVDLKYGDRPILRVSDEQSILPQVDPICAWEGARHLPANDVLLQQDVVCRQVSGTFPGANGINLWEDRLFVGDSKNGTITIFQIHDDQTLTHLQTVVSMSPYPYQ